MDSESEDYDEWSVEYDEIYAEDENIENEEMILDSASDVSSGSTDIILPEDEMSVSNVSDMELSDSDDRDDNELDNENEINNRQHNYALRSRSRTGGNVAPIPPSRISNVSNINSDTEMESVDGESSDGTNYDAEEEGDDRNNENSQENNNSDDNSEQPVTQRTENEQPTEQEQQNVLQINIVIQNSVEDTTNRESPNSNSNTVPNVQRLPLSDISSAQQIPDPLQKTPGKQKDEDEGRKAKRSRMSPDSNDDDAMTCSVCLDSFTNSGPHRLVSLRCGHIFGNSCVERWLKTGCMGGARRCPTCNKRAHLRDIRVIYAKKLQALDTCERDRLQMELEKVKQEKARLEIDLTKAKINCNLQLERIDFLTQRISVLEKNTAMKDQDLVIEKNLDTKTTSLTLFHSVELNNKGTCRVLSFSSNVGLVVVSQKSVTTLFPGYGIRKLDILDLRPTTFINLHNNVIRDLTFHPEDRNLLLSASIDHTAKLFDNVSNSIVQSFHGDHPLWSCAWDVNNTHLLMTGSQNGVISVFDRRQPTGAVISHTTLGDTTPVVALAPIARTRNGAFPVGGLLSCRLNAVYAYNGNSTASDLMMVDGPFVSLSYNPESQLVLSSTRSSSRFPLIRHMLSQFTSPDSRSAYNNVHTFTGGKSGQLMSRTCQIMMPDNDVWIAAHNESEHAVQLLSLNKSGIAVGIPVEDSVIDLCPFEVNNTCLLGSLSSKTLLVHKLY